MRWIYAWCSPSKDWESNFTYGSYDAAVDSAIWHARNARRRKNFFNIPPDKRQRQKIWRSMRQAGWRV